MIPLEDLVVGKYPITIDEANRILKVLNMTATLSLYSTEMTLTSHLIPSFLLSMATFFEMLFFLTKGK